MGKVGSKMLGPAALGLGGLFAVGAIFGRLPNEQKPVEAHADQAPSSDGTYVNPGIYAGAPPGAEPPTARLAQRGTGYERMTVKVSGNTMTGMTNEEIAAMISDEVKRQAKMDVNIKITSEDNRTTVDKQWLQQQFADALTTGYTH
jgi:hypothetical protein